MKFYNRTFLFLTFLFLTTEGLFAQGDPGVCFPPPCVPITDHIGWLIAALVGFGILKTIQYSRKTTVGS